MNTENRVIPAVLLAVAAFFLWYLSFAFPWGVFWTKLAISVSILAGISLFLSRKELSGLFSFRWRHLIIGILSAIILYGVFWFGKYVLSFLFEKSGTEIVSVYRMGTGFSKWIILLLLLMVTSPGEEIFWRGFVQKRIMEKIRPVPALLVTALIYASVHICTLNLTLILAALIAGLGWGSLYLVEKSIMPVIISHSLWTVSVFVLFPFV